MTPVSGDVRGSAAVIRGLAGAFRGGFRSSAVGLLPSRVPLAVSGDGSTPPGTVGSHASGGGRVWQRPRVVWRRVSRVRRSIRTREIVSRGAQGVLLRRQRSTFVHLRVALGLCLTAARFARQSTPGYLHTSRSTASAHNRRLSSKRGRLVKTTTRWKPTSEPSDVSEARHRGDAAVEIPRFSKTLLDEGHTPFDRRGWVPNTAGSAGRDRSRATPARGNT